MFSRLLKGAPPGQEAVNHYISELSIVKGGNHKLDTKYRKHLAMIEVKADCLASYFHFPPFSRLVKMSTTTTTSFLGKVPWTGTFYFLPFLLLWTTCLLLAAHTSDRISETSSSTTRS